MLDTKPLLISSDFPAIKRQGLEVLQANLGYLCNLSCNHCHVNAGPKRTELMERKTIDQLLQVLQSRKFATLDLTGGAPEMNPHFRDLVKEARALGVEVIDRCNLSILQQPDYEDLAQFLADQQVVITASLPCYSETNVTQQRGKGVFQDSIDALRKLNELGYGHQAELQLNLVYNPVGASLPPPQQELEADYKRELKENWGIHFNQLLAITNMPISRFGSVLLSKGQYVDYMSLLRNNFSPENLKTVMCRTVINVDWQGFIYDCDFNQLLKIPLAQRNQKRLHITHLMENDLTGNAIATGEHCYGCTAGQGSSCSGALSA
jgi:radical SAM/Cys-rich protein